MTSTLYLENYLDSLENLPVEVQRNLTLMRDLDSRAQELMRNIDKLTDDYLLDVKRLSLIKKKESMSTMQRHFDKVKEYGDDKIQLAKQTYELVDKHIRKLDTDLARFEGEIQEKAISATQKNKNGSQKRRNKKTNDKEVIKTIEEEKITKTPKKKQLKKGGAKTTSAAPSKTPLVNVITNPKNFTNSVISVAVETSSLTGALIGAGVAHSAEILDMPVDPNEPTYCLCNQVSYGEMIGCDNPDCPIEWFHFTCVKLITKPKGKWFCPKCTTDKKKK